MRQTWRPDALLFVSYVHSTSTAELNDFGSMFTNLDTPLLEPGGKVPPGCERAASPARVGDAAAAVPHRDVARGRLAHRLSVLAAGRVPALRRRPQQPTPADVFLGGSDGVQDVRCLQPANGSGLQVFNLTNHFNPRDVIAVVGSSRFGELTNNPGVLFGGYMQVRW